MLGEAAENDKKAIFVDERADSGVFCTRGDATTVLE